jgi:hypothetical protein
MDLRHNNETGRLTASFPANSSPQDLPKFVKIFANSGKASAHHQASMRRGASGNEIWVSQQTLRGLREGSAVSYGRTTEWRYRFYRLVHDRSQTLALIGLGMAFIGISADDLLSLWIPESSPLNLPRKYFLITLKFVEAALTFVGAIGTGTS